METTLIGRMKEFLANNPSPKLEPGKGLTFSEIRAYGRTPRTLFPPATHIAVEKAEMHLGFMLPPLLKSVLLEISNGICGFNYEILGVEGGYSCHFGNLIDTYFCSVKDWDTLRKKWPSGMLPFCSWGCNIFSCVDCADPKFTIHTIEDVGLYRQTFSLAEFFEMWLDGTNILEQEKVQVESVKIKNPFTGKGAFIKVRKRNES